MQVKTVWPTSRLFESRRWSYENENIEVVPGLRLKVYEGDYFHAPDHEIVYLLDGRVVAQELAENYRQRLAEIESNPQAIIDHLRASEHTRSTVAKAWEQGGFGKPL